MADTLKVFVFSPAWGLPSTGPFALKLLAWLGAHGIVHETVHEDRSSRGPLGKSPWIEQGGRRLGDSDLIIRHLAQTHGLPDPTAIGDAETARADAMKIAFEERFHQILEWELFVHPDGFAGLQGLVRAAVPLGLGGLVAGRMRRHFTRQLHARGLGRLAPADIADAGRRQLDSLAIWLKGSGGFLGGETPLLADYAVWGQVAPMLCWPMKTPVAGHARNLEAVVHWHERMKPLVGKSA